MQDRDLCGGGRETVRDAPADTDALLDLIQQFGEIQDDGAAGGRDDRATAFEDLQQLLLRGPIGLGPPLLHGRPGQHPAGGPVRELPQSAGRRARERLQPLR